MYVYSVGILRLDTVTASPLSVDESQANRLSSLTHSMFVSRELPLLPSSGSKTSRSSGHISLESPYDAT